MRHYQHTQIGWAIIWVVGAVAAVVVVALALAGLGSFAVLGLGALIVLPAVLFSTLRVTVTDDELEARFGPGPVRIRIPLASVQSCARVRNPWYYGFGMKFTPRGRLYNVSGFDAIELTFADGRHIRIGTNDPEGLLAAVQSLVGRAFATDVPDSGMNAAPVLAGLGLVFVSLLGVGWIVHAGTQPVAVVTSAEQIVVRGAFYSDAIRAADIVDVSLAPVLPSVARKTNGFNAGRTLRGTFRLRDGRSAHLFVEGGNPPFVQVRTTNDLVFINYKDPSQTKALYEQIRLLQSRR
jgi:hypothetical protein